MLTERQRQKLGNYPYLKVCSLLVLLLLLPFILQYRGPKTEVYPAVLLPAGLGLDHWTTEGSEHLYPAFYGFSDQAKGWRKLNVSQTVYPLSPAHAYAISRYLRREQPIPSDVWIWLNHNLSAQSVRTDTLLIGTVTEIMHPNKLSTPSLNDEIYLGNH